MNQPKLKNCQTVALAGVVVSSVLAGSAHAQDTTSNDPVVQVLIEKGIINQAEGAKVLAEIASRRTNMVNDLPAPSTSKWKLADSIESMQLFGDVRLRYEYRGANNVTAAGVDTFARERMRYAVRFGVRGDLVDKFSYGVRLETANNPRSPWDTFGNNTTAGAVTPSDKNSSSIYLGQAFLNWHPTDWYEMTVGRMAMPLYTTPMVWDSDINPEGAFEKFKFTVGNVDLFADFGQFDYQNVTSTPETFSGDTFLLAWQAGGLVHLNKNMFFKVAPMVYTYTAQGSGNGLNTPYVGQGLAGANVGVPGGANVAGYNQQGLDHLLILEIPAEFDLKLEHTPLGPLQTRVFGDFAHNITGNNRAQAAYKADPGAFPGLAGPVSGHDNAYQVGFGFGTAGPTYGPTQGLVYGSYAKKNSWEARVYYQHIEQYALDPNLIDSDFFEGRENLQGVYVAFAYSFTDAIIGTVRYGYADQIDKRLGTGGNNLDIPGINPISDFNLFQMDLTWKF